MSVLKLPLLKKTGQTGVSLIELVLFIVIISVGVVALMRTMNLSVQASADPMLRKQALAVAESMMEEILLKDFANPADPGAFTDAATQANRAQFDDVSDYHGFATTGIFPVNGTTVIPGLESYNIAVSVATSVLHTITAASREAKRVTVTVTAPDGTSIALDSFRANYAP